MTTSKIFRSDNEPSAQEYYECIRKTQYTHEYDAIRAQERHPRRHPEDPVEIKRYLCKWCYGWHLGHDYARVTQVYSPDGAGQHV